MDLEDLGEPSPAIGPLRLWVHGRQFEGEQDYWDGNWLRVTAHCAEGGSSVRVHGPIVHMGEIAQFLDGCQKLHETLSGGASLPCVEANLSPELHFVGSRGGLEGTVQITPDNLTQEHTFRFTLDQSFLPGIVAQCRALLRQFPIRGERPPAR